ncbi:MAG: addiction module protein [Planctomycetota bacterium]
MNINPPELFDVVFNLPEVERANLAYQLLQSLKPTNVLDEMDDQYEAELTQRVAAYDAGNSRASDWNEVAARLQKAIQERSSP